MKITITVEKDSGAMLTDSWSFNEKAGPVNFPTSYTDMNEEVNGMVEATVRDDRQ